MSEQSEGRETEARIEALKAQLAEVKEQDGQAAEEYYAALQAVLDLSEPGSTEHTRAVRQRLKEAGAKLGAVIEKRDTLRREITQLMPKQETSSDGQDY